MKIIHVLNHFLPQQQAGTEIYTWALCKEFIKKGINVKVLIPNYGKSYDEEYEYDGLIVYKYAEPSHVDRSLVMGFREPDGLIAFRAFLAIEKPDLVHFHELAGSNGIGIKHVREAKNIGIKIIMTFHLARYTCVTGNLLYKGKIICNGKIENIKCSICLLNNKGLNKTSHLIAYVSSLLNYNKIDTSKLNNILGTALGTASIISRNEENLNELIGLCDQVVCITKWYMDVLNINCVNMEKVTYIDQGLPTAFSQYIESDIHNTSPLKLMFLGRITPIKGLHLLLDALEFFPETEVELSIFGNSDGTNYESELRKKTKGKLNVIWRGSLTQDKVQERMLEHDLLCQCSTVCEMSPLVIQEARAAGMPVLASNVNGNKEQLANGAAGLLFETNDVESLKNQISNIMKNRYLIQDLKTKIQTPRNFSNVSEDYLQLYSKLLFS